MTTTALVASPGNAADAAFRAVELVREMMGADASSEGGLASWGAAQWEAVPRAELLALQRELVAQRRRLDAPLATASAEIDRRSQREDGAAGLARREGFPTSARQVADATGGSTGEAHRLIEVGKALLNASRPDAGDGTDGAPDGAGEDRAGSGEGLDGAAAGPRFRILARAVNTGRLSLDSANAISAMLTRVADVVEPERLAATERNLVERALTLPFDRLNALIRQCEAQLDAETARMKEEARRDSRYLHIYENRQGMVVIDGRLDVETAAPIKAAIDAMVGDAFRRKREHGCGCEGNGVHGHDQGEPGHAENCDQRSLPLQDDRSAPQMRADALADLAKHCLGCEAKDLPLPKATVVVRVSKETLESGVGLGEIDGFDELVSASTLRRMAADAEVIPMVLGGESEVLDQGRAKRLFTSAQRRALVERDGGCAWCHAPPAYTEAHHIRWWYRDTGPSDLSNGVLLCSSCHHRIHRDDWGIEVRGNTVWFTPPGSVDRARTPLQGGRARFQYAQAA